MTTSAHKSFLMTKKAVDEHQSYPSQPGIYALFLTDQAHLGDFGQPGRLIYIGIAKKSLHDRDFDQHFRSGQTGRSTLRRSLGAILKNEFMLTAIPRGGANDSKRFNNYRFTDSDEMKLTKWMERNLEIGCWIPNTTLPYEQLRDEEKRVTIELRPTLDLDRRTRKYNPLANKLDKLRKTCIAEAQKDSNL